MRMISPTLQMDAGWLLMMNLGTFLLMRWDKMSAVQGRRRVAERTLLGLVVLGGVVGVAAAIAIFNHKRSKRSFQLKMLVAAVLSLILRWILVG